MTDNAKVPHRKWWIENPDAPCSEDPSSLCDICRHINFRHLIFECTAWQVLEEIPLDSYSNILTKKARCAFCQLVKVTLDNWFGEGELPSRHEEKDVMISMISTTKWVDDTSKPRHLFLWVKPNPYPNKGKIPDLRIHYAPEGSWLDEKGMGRLVQSESLDYILALYWTRTCQKGMGIHKDDPSQSEEHQGLPANFRVIDVKAERVVCYKPGMEYVTLSYVWPSDGQLCLRGKDDVVEGSETLSKLMGPEGFSEVEFKNRIPQTIKDAMVLVGRLAYQYLWVDALCIIQDDKADKDLQINAMDRIYGLAMLTIAATAGKDATAGLPGVTPKTERQPNKSVANIQGLRLTNPPRSWDQSVQHSNWNRRAWTCQERLLSKRTLFVADQQMFYKCNHSPVHHSEDTDDSLVCRSKVTHPMDDTGIDTIPETGSINILTYMKVVENFTKREITFEDDFLNAFDGIAQRMRSLFRSDFLSGLPQAELDYCLLWQPCGSGLTRRKMKKKSGEKEEDVEIFPSWTWAGWIGPVEYAWCERLSRVEWVDENGQQFTSGCFRAPTAAGPKSDASDWETSWVQNWIDWGFRYFHHVANPDVWFRNKTAPESERAPHKMNSSHLKFWADTIEIDIPKSNMDWKVVEEIKDPILEFGLCDKQGFASGLFRTPREMIPKLKTQKLDMVKIVRTRHSLSPADIRARKGEPDGTVENRDAATADRSFDIKSKPLEDYDDRLDETLEPAYFPDEVSMGEEKNRLSFDRQRFDAYKPFCLYEILVVTWGADGIASRVGIGEMHMDAWAQEKDKTRKLIVLG